MAISIKKSKKLVEKDKSNNVVPKEPISSNIAPKEPTSERKIRAFRLLENCFLVERKNAGTDYIKMLQVLSKREAEVTPVVELDEAKFGRFITNIITNLNYTKIDKVVEKSSGAVEVTFL